MKIFILAGLLLTTVKSCAKGAGDTGSADDKPVLIAPLTYVYLDIVNGDGVFRNVTVKLLVKIGNNQAVQSVTRLQ